MTAEFRNSDADKLREDAAETAFRTLQEAIGEREKTLPPGKRTKKKPEAVKRGRKGGKKGAKARSAALTPEQRREAARVAATARWKKPDTD